MSKPTLRKRKQLSTIKRIAHKLHLWLGLISGSIVLVMALTGCIYVFQDELQDLTRPWRKVVVENKPYAAPSTMFTHLAAAYSNAKASAIIYQGLGRPAQVRTKINEQPHHIYFNPYSGAITHVQLLEDDFFIAVERLHRFLLLPKEIGRPITGISTIIFLVMLISGLILWWPKKWKRAGQNFTIKWKARWRRKNYDLHRTIGFYMIFPAMIIALTGLTFSYEILHDAVYPIGNAFSNISKDKEMPVLHFGSQSATTTSIDLSFQKTLQLAPDSEMYFILDQGAGHPILSGAYPDALAYDHQSNYYFHPKTAQLIHAQPYDDKSTGMQLQEMNFGLHTGQYFGLFGKIMAFLGSLFVAALPVTGFMMWYGRRKKTSISIAPSTRVYG